MLASRALSTSFLAMTGAQRTMSFPPRPPMGMPPVPPGMMTSSGYFPTMGMMPMSMGMMPATQMMPASMGMSSNTNSNSTSNSTTKQSKKLVPQEIPKETKEDKPPPTTVFVGNISERAPDAMVRQMLQRCGNVLSWKRVQGASGKLQAFGFCEYEDPEATLRCMRLLNEWKISDKKLVVKVDAKTKTLLDDYKARKKAREKLENRTKEKDDKGDNVNIDLDEFTQREDRVAKAGLDAIMREYADDLSKEPASGKESPEDKKDSKKDKKKEKEKDVIKDAGLDDMELEDDKKDLINREIRSFRDAHKGEEEKEKEREKERERERRRRLEEDRERERIRERKEREREREREELERKRLRRDKERSRSRDRSRSRSRERSREREKEIREREKDWEDEEELYERRKLERKLREKEAAYQERLKNWEARERKKAREYEKEKEKEEERRTEEIKEARRLKEFLEDYDDERDDPKYYKGSALQRRLKEREKEMEADNRDRTREKEEIEEIRRQLLEEGYPDVEEKMARIEQERAEHLLPRLQKSPEPLPEPTPPPPVQEPEVKPPVNIKMQPTLKPVEPAPSVSSQSSPESDNEETGIVIPPSSEDSQSQPFIGPVPKEEQQAAKIGFTQLVLGASNSPNDAGLKRKKLTTVESVFSQDDDETEAAKKRKLVPLSPPQNAEDKVMLISKPTTAEEKRKHIKNLIERIPTGKDELFAYVLDWNMVDTVLMDRRIKPWVNRKIVEYIGEEEPTLTDFICQKVMAHSMPQNILNDVAMVLDEEAEVFVVKMWRLLIYETEAKKAGLVK